MLELELELKPNGDNINTSVFPVDPSLIVRLYDSLSLMYIIHMLVTHPCYLIVLG